MTDRQAIDEQIAAYVRAAVHADPPADLVPSILEAVDDARPRRAWFAPMIPALAVVTVVLVAAGLTLFVSRPWLLADPSPEPTSTPSAEATPTAEPSPTLSPSLEGLFEPGDGVEFPAVDSQGEWGTVRVERGEELGGYADADTDADVIFVIEFLVEYQPERMPQPAEFGVRDWVLRPTDPNAVHFFLAEPAQFERQGGGTYPSDPLGLYPGAVDIFTTPARGWIAFRIPRNAADLGLELGYWPAGVAQPAATVPVRRPGDPPAPVAPERLGGTPPPEYVEQPSLPITVIDSAEADDLFSRPDTCTNPVDGWTVTFPDDWYTNTEIGDVPACSWFTSELFEVTDASQMPEEIWISLRVVDGVVGYTGLTEMFMNEEVTIDGITARRVESNHQPNTDPDNRDYHYVITLGDEFQGPTFVAETNTRAADDYLLSRAVLDRIMASLEFEP